MSKTQGLKLAQFSLIGTLVFLTVGCETADQNQKTNATAAPVSSAEPSSTSVASTSTTTVAQTESTSNANPLGGNSPEDFLMPNVVCMNLQEAQDEIQDHGVFYSKSEDATGAGRMQLIDRNWVVVAQRPAPGTKISEGDAVLSAVKIGESTGGKC